ncbi:MAG: hypothetical protein KJ655_04745 [Candidatus Thermoplasmatota archaeon]|nr:hypothetical protein [Candidatus Thermoplasmatota archaeon]
MGLEKWQRRDINIKPDERKGGKKMFEYRKLSEMKGVTGTYKEEHDKPTCAVASSRAVKILEEHFPNPMLTPIDRMLSADVLIRQ